VNESRRTCTGRAPPISFVVAASLNSAEGPENGR
jgi:hypothetical protein